MKKIYAILLLCFATNLLHAQWTSNTVQNTLVANKNASDIQTANTSDGKTWIAFYSQRGNNYDMRAQLLDAAGNRLLGDSGVLVSSKKSGSATFVFNVCVDVNNNFVIAFQVQNGSAYECGMQKVSTEGQLLWGDGIDLGPGLSPYPATLSGNAIAVAWSNNGKIDYQKVSAAGVSAWMPYKEYSSNSGHSVSRPQVVAGTLGKFSIVYQDVFAFPFYTNLFEQQFSNNGTAVWPAATKLSSLATASYRYYDVHIEGDTTYVGYYGNPQSSNRFDAFVQRINANGSLPWGTNGSAFADFSGNNDPYEQTIYIAKASGANDVWAVCTVTNSFQTTSSIYVQKYNAQTGSRYLGNNAKALSPLSDKLVSLAYSKLSLCGNEPLFIATDNSNKLGAVKLNSNGNYAWPDMVIPIATSSNTKYRYGFTDVYNGQAVAVWQEDKGSGDMPYAQNIKCNGTTGAAAQETIVANVQPLINNLSIKNVYPNPVQSVLTATISSAVKSNLHIYITGVSGNIIKQYQQNIRAGNNTVQLNVSSLNAGTYFIKVMNGNNSAAALFNKQ